jgi:hypothetical protein
MDDKLGRDRSGEPFQDEFTENETKARGEVREDAEDTLRLDPDVDSQDADQALKENRFGLNQPKQKT